MALFNRKDKEDKKHKGENIVGKIIYAFLLFAPLFSILTTSLYTIFNKNAFESYYGETINEEQINKVDHTNLKIGSTYTWNNTNSLVQVEDEFVPTNMYVKDVIDNTGRQDFSNINHLKFFMYPSPTATRAIVYLMIDNSPTYQWDVNTNTIDFTFTIESILNKETLEYFNYFYETTYNKYSYLDNSFDYGIYKTEQNNLFNWSKTTGMYQVMQTTTSQLGITNTFTPMLLTYWLIISVIYFIYDIALMLVWILHRKIHELTESV